MVIEVDDSGWGDLVGGVVIVLRRVETDEDYSGEIPLELFQGIEFKYKGYLRSATQVILEGLDRLNASTDEAIHICTGYVFTHAKDTLIELGYRVTEVKIVGKTQNLTENRFIESLVSKGLGTKVELFAKRSFNGWLNWVKEDLANREQYVKTGWTNWPKHRDEK
jgi:hypothetical protein